MATYTIMLGVSGSIAAYKAVDVLRRLQERGAEVRVVMTEHATRFVSRLTFEALSGRPVLVDEFRDWGRGGIAHVDAAAGLDAAVVAPATANIIGKAAAGIADDALSSALLALTCPLVMAPAMNDNMYRHPAVQRNIAALRERGVRFVDPETGFLACGTEGQGRLAATDRIVEAVLSGAGSDELKGTTIVVTAGPTREPIDAVRFISSPSSGKMGFAIADAAHRRGAKVVLITGPTALEGPPGVDLIRVTTADEMRRKVQEQSGAAAAVIMAAAVSDFRPAEPSTRKLKKDEAPRTIALERTADILEELGASKAPRVLVGFAAETERIEEHAEAKLRRKGLDLIVANDVLREGAGFESDTNIVTIIDREGATLRTPRREKRAIAEIILDKTAEVMKKKGLLP